MSAVYRGEEHVSFFTALFGHFKRGLIIIYLLAVLFSALVIPFFRDSIIATVRNWLGVPG